MAEAEPFHPLLKDLLGVIDWQIAPYVVPERAATRFCAALAAEPVSNRIRILTQLLGFVAMLKERAPAATTTAAIMPLVTFMLELLERLRCNTDALNHDRDQLARLARLLGDAGGLRLPHDHPPTGSVSLLTLRSRSDRVARGESDEDQPEADTRSVDPGPR